METLALIGTITIIHLLAVISPGPDFIMACRNSLIYSRKTGIWTAVGFGFGIMVHIFYSLAGLALIISKSILLSTNFPWKSYWWHNSCVIDSLLHWWGVLASPKCCGGEKAPSATKIYPAWDSEWEYAFNWRWTLKDQEKRLLKTKYLTNPKL